MLDLRIDGVRVLGPPQVLKLEQARPRRSTAGAPGHHNLQRIQESQQIRAVGRAELLEPLLGRRSLATVPEDRLRQVACTAVVQVPHLESVACSLSAGDPKGHADTP